MKDSILHSALITVAFAIIAVSTIDQDRAAPEPTMAQADRVVKMEKTVVNAKRLHPDITLATAVAH